MNTKPVPMPGKLLKRILTSVCDKPGKGDPDFPEFSIAIGPNGIAATDKRQALIVGELDDVYVPTLRNSALLEAERAIIYADTCAFNNIERLVDEETGEPKSYPPIAVVLENMNRMVHVADFDPEMLKRAAQVAIDAGSSRVSLYQKPSDDEHSLLGFAFKYSIDIEQLEFNFDAEEGQDNESLFRDIDCKAVIGSLDKKSRIDNEVEVHKTADEALKKAFNELTENGSVSINGVTVTDPNDLKKHIEGMFVKAEDQAYQHLFFDAAAFASLTGEISTAMLQHRFRIGFQTASKLIAQMEEWGICSERDGPRPRKVLVTTEELKALVDKARDANSMYNELVGKLTKGETVSPAIIKRTLATDMENAKVLFEKLDKNGLLDKDGNGARTFKGAK